MSRATSYGRYTPAGEHVDRLRWRLRSGAMARSRSAITRTEVLEQIVDVGEGVTANMFEQLLARLEQHGLRRCLADEANDIGAAAAGDDGGGSGSRGGEQAEGHHIHEVSRPLSEQPEGDARKPYYYLCVPCELRLTDVLMSAATLAMLQDAHYHFSSAEHRRIASWMGETDIDCTLQTSSELDPTAYARIHVNGVPMLLSTRPGGGDMFFPLPHEVRERDITALSGAGEPLQLASSEPHTEVWNQPLRSIFTGAKQLLYTAEDREEVCVMHFPSLACRRSFTVVQHIPMEVYREESFVGCATVPALFEVAQKRLLKEERNPASSGGFRVGYAVAEKPTMIWQEDADPTSSRTVVRHDGIYRIVLLHSDFAARLMSEGDQHDGLMQTSIKEDKKSQMLTAEALSQFRTASTGRAFCTELNASELSNSGMWSRSEEPSDVSS
ncbi:hypothetical protein DQ04_00911050 [Trypanosoma grayi]|uniref:hypothetical protein n=1 Tax=Trypanosoma grayi TaxID=71804 RepID=UPI0004F47CA8|nr:hypothetical protein DQ04_00911050 [Trypanosoma grayi]KEG13593.1 hypothetical protein DQ04_00911050 [Trypanosoma grayi]